MGDMGEIFNAMKDESKERRARNRQSSAELLKSRGIEFEEKNCGAHLIITHSGRVFDFWPGTGKWTERGTNKYRRGVKNLLKRLAPPTHTEER